MSTYIFCWSKCSEEGGKRCPQTLNVVAWTYTKWRSIHITTTYLYYNKYKICFKTTFHKVQCHNSACMETSDSNVAFQSSANTMAIFCCWMTFFLNGVVQYLPWWNGMRSLLPWRYLVVMSPSKWDGVVILHEGTTGRQIIRTSERTPTLHE